MFLEAVIRKKMEHDAREGPTPSGPVFETTIQSQSNTAHISLSVLGSRRGSSTSIRPSLVCLRPKDAMQLQNADTELYMYEGIGN